MAASSNMRVILGSALLLASTVGALWPASLSDMAASFSAQGSQRRKLLQAGFSAGEVSESCTCTKEIQGVDSRCRDNEVSIQDLRTSLEALKEAVSGLKKSGKGVASPQSYNIAFSARVGYNRPYLGETEVIVFDELVINNGDVYDPYSGKFTSPVPGLYHFETTILSGFNATIETMLVLNGNEVGRVFSGGFNNRGSGSNSVLLNMEAGDEVWVSVFFGNGDYVHGLWSTFTGYLVYPYNL